MHIFDYKYFISGMFDKSVDIFNITYWAKCILLHK